jgi:hypothetical protein
MQRAYDGAHERGLAAAQRPAQRDDVTGYQRPGELGRKGLEIGAFVEDVIL